MVIDHARCRKLDGLTSLPGLYNVLSVTEQPLFTQILVSVTGPKHPKEISQYFKDKEAQLQLKLS